MASIEDEYRCGVCNKLYTYPVVHRLCGMSFDRQCIESKCPAKECNKLINENDLITNYSLLKIVDEYRLTLEIPHSYYTILLDTSTSMWYSDSIFPFAFGESRFLYAMQFLEDFFNHKANSGTELVSLVTFDTVPLERFDFETIDKKHLDILKTIECDGKDTALFDSIDYCVTKFENLKKIHGEKASNCYLIIITDGGNNFGKKEQQAAVAVAWRSRQLHITGHIIQLGDKNRKNSRRICDFIKYKFNHFKGGNVHEFVNSLTNSIRTEIQSRRAQVLSKNQRAQVLSENQSAQQIINQLPDVPNTAPKLSARTPVLA